MNGPFVVAQANSVNSGATPVQVIKLIKPEAGHTEIFHASFSGLVKIDFSAIANEKITLFHDSKNQSLHIIFADGSQDIIEPFFDLRGTILSNLLLDMGSGQEFNGERFASQFPITEDQSVLPAAGPGGVAAGADFHGPFVDGLFTGNPLDLLPPEELPGLQFTITATPLLTEDNFTIGDQIIFQDDGPTVTSALSGSVVADETAGVQNTADPNAQNDVASSGLPAGVLSLFDNITNKGSDPDVAVKDHNAIGFATSSSPIVLSGVNFGADGPAASNSKVLSFVVSGGDGADSGLQTTDGHAIFLFKEGDLIVGRYDGADSGTGVTNNGTDPAAFAIALGQDGNISIAQYVSLKNPIPGSTDAAHDEPATGLKNILVSVTATDGDGDFVTQNINVSANIVFQDDGPTINAFSSGTVIQDETAGVQNTADPNSQNDVAGQTYPRGYWRCLTPWRTLRALALMRTSFQGITMPSDLPPAHRRSSRRRWILAPTALRP